jgi:hypothetical protein
MDIMCISLTLSLDDKVTDATNHIIQYIVLGVMLAKTPSPKSKNPITEEPCSIGYRIHRINKTIEIPNQNRVVNCHIYGSAGLKEYLRDKFKVPTGQDIFWQQSTLL